AARVGARDRCARGAWLCRRAILSSRSECRARGAVGARRSHPPRADAPPMVCALVAPIGRCAGSRGVAAVRRLGPSPVPGGCRRCALGAPPDDPVAVSHADDSRRAATIPSMIASPFDALIARAREHPLRVVFPEAADPRTLAAVARLQRDEIVRPILVGSKATVAA